MSCHVVYQESSSQKEINSAPMPSFVTDTFFFFYLLSCIQILLHHELHHERVFRKVTNATLSNGLLI